MKHAQGADQISDGGEADPNTEIHVPKSKEVKDAERRERLRQEVCRPIPPCIRFLTVVYTPASRTAEEFKIHVEEEKEAREIHRA